MTDSPKKNGRRALPSRQAADFHVIEDAYDQTILCLARLEFAVSAVLDANPNAWRIRQTNVAIADFLNFALHCRRLIAACNLERVARDLKLRGRPPKLTNGQPLDMSFWDILNIIVHSRRIAISVAEVGQFIEPFETHLGMNNRTSVIDYFLVESDRFEKLLVPGHSLLEAFDSVLYVELVLYLGDSLNRLRTS